MNKGKRVACFFTAGYTELNAMKSFMCKIYCLTISLAVKSDCITLTGSIA
jgi:hypothetical protein